MQQTLLTPTSPKKQRRPTHASQRAQKPNLEEIQPTVDQQYSDSDYETQDLAETRFEPQRNEGHSSKKGGMEIRGYRGGYGDKNPLLVASESATRPRTVERDGDNEDDEMMKSNGNKPEMETQTKGSISIGKMMSLRMSTSQKKSKGNMNMNRGPMNSNPNGRKSEQNDGPTMIANPGRLMHYPKSRNIDNNNSRGDLDN